MSNAIAQTQSTGKVRSYKKNQSGIEGKTASGIFDVQVYSDNIIRVRISKQTALTDFSYALDNAALPMFNSADVQTRGKLITIATKAIVAEIQQPFLHRFPDCVSFS